VRIFILLNRIKPQQTKRHRFQINNDGGIFNQLIYNQMKKITKSSLYILALLIIGSCSKGPSSEGQTKDGKVKDGISALEGEDGVLVALPGGRAYYVVSLMGGTFPNKWVRLAQYKFTTAGTVTEQFKYYTQGQSGDHYSNKVLTGFNTSQATCDYTCPVKTCIGFQPGQAWSTLSGTYYINSLGKLVIDWSGGYQEAWSLSSPKPYYTRLDINTSNYGVAHGYGYGSNTNFDTGVTTATIMAAGDLKDTDYWSNNYQANDAHTNYAVDTSYLALGSFQQCVSSVIKLNEANQIPCPKGHYKLYIAGNPLAEPTDHKRKNYRQHQKGEVGCKDEGWNTCISPMGGHIMLYLQVLDDAGIFRGFIGAEATLGVGYGGRILAVWREVKL
jgi:hypothetical protein